MSKKSAIVYSALLTLGCSGLTFTQATYASGFNPMNMMNPSKWFGGKKNRRYDDDYYYDRDRYGPGYGYGRGWGGYGPGWGGYGPGYGYGPGWGGYGRGYGYGYGGPGYNQSGSKAAPPPLPQ